MLLLDDYQFFKEKVCSLSGHTKLYSLCICRVQTVRLQWPDPECFRVMVLFWSQVYWNVQYPHARLSHSERAQRFSWVILRWDFVISTNPKFGLLVVTAVSDRVLGLNRVFGQKTENYWCPRRVALKIIDNKNRISHHVLVYKNWSHWSLPRKDT